MTRRPQHPDLGDPLLSAAATLWARSEAVGRLPAVGNSMAPTIQAGDKIRLRAGERPRWGDVVVAVTDRGLLVHRVVARRGDELELRGDNSPRPDAPIASSAVLGIVKSVERHGGRVRRLDGPGSRAVAIVTAAYSRGQTALRRGPRPKHLPAAFQRLADRCLGVTTPEEAFVLRVARRTVSPEAAEEARWLASRGLDWDCVLQLAVLGQLGPLLYLGSRQLAADDCPPAAVAQRLRTLYAASWTRGRRLEELLVRVLERLAAEDIPVLGHKAAALAVLVFGDWALHLSGDLDLSVPDADHDRASRATHDIRQPLAAAHPDRRDPAGYHIELDRSAHHDLDPSRHGGGRWQAEPLDWPAIWAAARPVTVGGQPMLIPQPTDLVLTLVANAVRRGFTPVRLVSDLAETIRCYGATDHCPPSPVSNSGPTEPLAAIDWLRLEQALRRSRLDRRSWIALDLCADWFGAAVPPALLEPPDDLRPAAHEWWILEHKRRRPFWRVPSRVLWAGSARHAVVTAGRLLWNSAKHRR